MKQEKIIRQQLLDQLEGMRAHVNFDTVVKGIPSKFYGASIKDLPYTLWELLEHIRRAQHDILQYIQDPNYISPDWPEGYWPKTRVPSNTSAWYQSIKKFQDDLDALKKLVKNSKIDLFSQVPHGKKGHTIFREILLVADHNTYHLGQMVVIRRLLGIWKS